MLCTCIYLRCTCIYLRQGLLLLHARHPISLLDPSTGCTAVSVVKDKLASVKRKLLVLSGKGGVGKTTTACQLAFALAKKGFQVRAGAATSR